MIDSHIPLEQRLIEGSDPFVMQGLNDILLNYEEDLNDAEKETIRKTMVLIAAVQEARANRAEKRIRHLQATEKGQITFTASKSGNNIELQGNFPKYGTSSFNTAVGQEVVIKRVGGSCEVVIRDPTPL